MHRAQPELDLTYAWFRSSRRLESCPSGAQARGRSGRAQDRPDPRFSFRVSASAPLRRPCCAAFAPAARSYASSSAAPGSVTSPPPKWSNCRSKSAHRHAGPAGTNNDAPRTHKFALDMLIVTAVVADLHGVTRCRMTISQTVEPLLQATRWTTSGRSAASGRPSDQTVCGRSRALGCPRLRVRPRQFASQLIEDLNVGVDGVVGVADR